MTAPVLDRHVLTAAPGPELDLRGLDFGARRRRLFAALRALRATEELRVTGAGPHELYWLRYELEARLERRYCWALAEDSSGAAVRTVVHPCPSRTTGGHAAGR